MSDVLRSVHLLRLSYVGVLTTDHDTLYALAHDAYTRYYGPWLLSDTKEHIIAKIAADMGIAGCSATFAVRKDVAREVLEKEGRGNEERTV